MKVMQVESLITKMQNYVLEVCQVVNSEVTPPETNCVSVYLEVMKKLYCHISSTPFI